MILDLKKVYLNIEWYNAYEYADPREDPYNPLLWLSLDDYEFYKEEYIKKEYGYATENEIAESGFYVPLFPHLVDTVKLLEEFLEENYQNYPYDKEVVRQRINAALITPGGSRWGEYRKQKELAAAEAWCKKYHIRYKK